VPLRIDAGPKALRRQGPGSGTLHERDRRLLFCEPIGQLGRRGDACLELCPPIRGERSVCERSKLGDLSTAYIGSATASQGHDRTNGSSLSGAERNSTGPERRVAITISRASKLSPIAVPFRVVASCS
jgi:hypothetical protein